MRPPCIGFRQPWWVRLRRWLRWRWQCLKMRLSSRRFPGEIRASRIQMLTFMSSPVVRWTDIGRRKYDIIRPAQFRAAMDALWMAAAEAAEIRSFGPAAMGTDLPRDPFMPSLAAIAARRREAAAMARKVVASFRASGDPIPKWLRPDLMDDLAFYRLLRFASKAEA